MRSTTTPPAATASPPKSKLEIGGLKAGASEVLYETVTVTFDSVQRLAA